MVDCAAAVAAAVSRANLRRWSMEMRRRTARRTAMKMMEAMMMRKELEVRRALWAWMWWFGGGGVEL